MKKVVEDFLLLCLVCFSFFYTDKVINMINENDPLMMEIIDVKDYYSIVPVDAIIDDDTIIPGIKGRELDVYDSYDNMRLGGVFREEALIFKELFPIDSLNCNKDKYIVKGNGNKKQVSIIYIFDGRYKDVITSLEGITLFVNHKDLGISNINNLKNNEIYTYGNNGLYDNEIIMSDNVLIERLSNNKSNYCLVKEKKDDVLETCSNNDMYTILPNIIGGYYEVKNNLSNGSIILLDSIKDIDVVVRYIKGKGYDIVSLSELLSE